MDKSKTIVVLLVTVLNLMTFTNGLECYSCYYDDGLETTPAQTDLEGMKWHPSCQKGRSQDESLNRTCAAFNYNGQVIQPMCMQLYTELNRFNFTERITARGCVHMGPTYASNTPPLKPNECANKVTLVFREFWFVGPMKNALIALEERYNLTDDRDTAWEFCPCDSDNCNGGPASVGPGHIVVISSAVLAVATSFLFSIP